MQPDPRSEVDQMVADLRVALDAVERTARLAQPGPWHIGNAVDPTKPCNVHTFPAASGVADDVRWLDAEHIALNNPARVLRQVAAHRAMLGELEAMPHEAGDDFACPMTVPANRWTGMVGKRVCECGRNEFVERMVRLLASAYADETGRSA